MLSIMSFSIYFNISGSLFKLEGMGLYEQLYEKYGPVVRVNAVLKPDVLILFDAESIAKIFYGENRIPVRPAFFSMEYYRRYYKNKDPNKPTGLVTDQGYNWRQFRSKVGPALLMPKFVKLYSKTVDEVALETIARWRRVRDHNNMIRENFDREMNLWSLESIAVVALGTRLNSLDAELPKDSPVNRLIECAHDLLLIANELDYKPSLWKYYPTKMFKRAMKVYEDIDIITKHYIANATEKFKNNGKTGDEESILEKLLKIDEEVAHIMASDMLIAGVDTTSNTMLATMYLLAMNPEKQQKLREEVLSNDEKKPYLKACIKESMRLMPVVGLNFRETTRSYDILGYEVPKGMGVLFCHRLLSLLESNFPKAQQFIPERWIVDESDPMHNGSAHPFVHLPFGFGVRSCIGQRIAELEIETLLSRVVQNFNLEWVGPPPTVHSTHVNYVKGPYNFILNDIV
ncbi:hypothetical protein O3G_MSEX011953 [Manduca sexta]|uniref:Cytochrome P450 n=1 Tax=Manduca sexta TaxID=7130 RepID=A0A921ZLY4_MANSE|nr:hypothetical protein O3G_MSEX011953 [Manduca sexta]